jgi:superfamily I DNA/RNA helicase
MGISANHVFPVASSGALPDRGEEPGEAAWRIAQARKTAFAYADSRLKVSTVHSFKGWEAPRVVLVLPLGQPTHRTTTMVYVGLTRARGDLVLVGPLQDYGLGELPDFPDAVIDPRVALRFRALLRDAREALTQRDGRAAASGMEPTGLYLPE